MGDKMTQGERSHRWSQMNTDNGHRLESKLQLVPPQTCATTSPTRTIPKPPPCLSPVLMLI